MNEEKLEIELKGEDLGIDFKEMYGLCEDKVCVDIHLHLDVASEEFIGLLKKVAECGEIYRDFDNESQYAITDKWKLKLVFEGIEVRK